MKSLVNHYGLDAFSINPIFDSSWTAGDLVAKCGGLSVGNGIYRIPTKAMATSFEEALGVGFPDIKGRYSVFGHDWLGRIFAHRIAGDGHPECILLFETGAGEVINIPATISQLHEVDLIQHRRDSLAYDFFEQWRRANHGIQIKISECAGYKKPLFLGGKDILENLEVIDVEVYTQINSQLRAKILRHQ